MGRESAFTSLKTNTIAPRIPSIAMCRGLRPGGGCVGPYNSLCLVVRRRSRAASDVWLCYPPLQGATLLYVCVT